MTRRWAEEGRRVGEPTFTKARVVPQDGTCHSQKTKRVVVTKEIHQRGLCNSLRSQRRRDGDAWSKGAVRRAGFQVDAESMGILGMLKQEPSAIKRLLACCANIA